MRETEGADLEGVPCLERPAGRALRIPIERHPHRFESPRLSPREELE